jgi:hypothetical protein
VKLERGSLSSISVGSKCIRVNVVANGVKGDVDLFL